MPHCPQLGLIFSVRANSAMSRVPFKDTRIDTAERSVATSSTVAADKRKLATFTKKTISRSVIRRIQPDNKDDPP